MTAPAVHVRHETRPAGVVAFVTLDNAAKLNALNAALMEAFAQAFETLAARDDLRAVVLTGAGDRAFVGGADVDELAALSGRTPPAPSSARSIAAARRCAPRRFR